MGHMIIKYKSLDISDHRDKSSMRYNLYNYDEMNR